MKAMFLFVILFSSTATFAASSKPTEKKKMQSLVLDWNDSEKPTAGNRPEPTEFVYDGNKTLRDLDMHLVDDWSHMKAETANSVASVIIDGEFSAADLRHCVETLKEKGRYKKVRFVLRP